jgi:hypothetical protein
VICPNKLARHVLFAASASVVPFLSLQAALRFAARLPRFYARNSDDLLGHRPPFWWPGCPSFLSVRLPQDIEQLLLLVFVFLACCLAVLLDFVAFFLLSSPLQPRSIVEPSKDKPFIPRLLEHSPSNLKNRVNSCTVPFCACWLRRLRRGGRCCWRWSRGYRCWRGRSRRRGSGNKRLCGWGVCSGRWHCRGRGSFFQ